MYQIKTCFEQWSCAFFLRSLYKDVTQRDMSFHLTPSSDWDGWTPPDIDQISDIPTIGSDQDINDLASALADADATPQARRQRRKSRKRRRTSSTAGVAAGPISRLKSQKRRRTLSTAGVVAGPTSRRSKIRVRGKRRQRRAPKNALDALSTMATNGVPTSPRKISRKKARRVVKSNTRNIPTSTVRQMIRASKGGVWLDSRATLHSLVSKMPWAKVPLVQ